MSFLWLANCSCSALDDQKCRSNLQPRKFPQMERGTEYAILGGLVHALGKVVNMVVSPSEAGWRASRRAWQCGWMRCAALTINIRSKWQASFYASTPKNRHTNGPMVCFLRIHLAEWLPRCERTCGNGHALNDGEDAPCRTRLICADAGIGLVLDTRYSMLDARLKLQMVENCVNDCVRHTDALHSINVRIRQPLFWST